MSQSGFRPNHQWFPSENRSIHGLADLRTVPLLALLGQPGMGKSTAIEDEIAALSKLGIVNARFELSGLDSGHWLQTELGESAAVAAWQSGNEVHLFLDGLDRATVNLSTIQRALEVALGRSPDRMTTLRLRIACRSADWDPAVVDRLSGLWPSSDEGQAHVARTLELLGLSRDDFKLAAQQKGLHGDALLEEVAKAGAEPMAATPVTTRMILDRAKRGGGIGSRTELYHDAVRELVYRRTNPRGCEEQSAVQLSANSLLAMAARQAAALLLCDRSTIAADDDAGPSDVKVGQITGGTEPPFDGDVDLPPVSAEAYPMLATHATGLMRVDDSRRATFVHQTYAEYLCARWLSSGALTIEQVEGLILSPHDPKRRLLSHLRDVAGWLAVLRPDAFRALIVSQAEVLLRGDLALLEPESRQHLVEALLHRAQDEDISVQDARVRQNLGRLGYPGLAQRLECLLTDTEGHGDVRRLAVALASTNRLVALVEPLVAIALSESEPGYLRRAAVQAVGSIASVEDRLRLLPLARGSAVDADDELKGASLEALWPSTIDGATLVDCLTPPKRRNFIGTYRWFLYHAGEAVADRDLPTVLRWCAQNTKRSRYSSALSDFADTVLRTARDHLDDDDVAQSVAAVVISRISDHAPLLSHGLGQKREEVFLDDPAARQRLLELMVDAIGSETVHASWIAHQRPALLTSEDLPWLCDAALREPVPARREVWASLVDAVFYPERGSVNVVLEAMSKSDELAQRLSYWTREIRLDSAEADDHRAHWRLANFTSNDTDDDAEEPFDVDARVDELLAEGEAGDLDAWWQIAHFLRFEADGRDTGSFTQITRLPGWNRRDGGQRARLLNLAEKYLDRRDAEPAKWFGQSIGWRPAQAGYRALVLLEEECPDRLAALDGGRWDAWAPIIVSYSRPTNPETDSELRVLTRLAQRRPAALVQWAEAMVRADDAAGSHPRASTQLLSVLALPALQSAILKLADDKALRPSTRLDLHQALLRQQANGAVSSALAALRRTLSTRAGDATGQEDDTRAAAGLISALLQWAPSEAWDPVWASIQAWPHAGRAAIGDLAERESFEAAAHLSESAVADLYLWLCQEYPPADDPPAMSGYLSTREQVIRWRDRLLNVLIHGVDPVGVDTQAAGIARSW